MASVWYLGTADKRTIKASEWTAAGIAGASTVTWDKSNGFSVPQANFTQAQLDKLALDPGFRVGAPDGVRSGPTPPPSPPPSEVSVTLASVDQAVADSVNTPGGRAQVAGDTRWGPKIDRLASRGDCLRPFWNGLAGRASAPVDILTIGDSITEGRGATNNQDQRAWFARLLDGLRTRYPVPGVVGGEGWVTASPASPNRTVRWVRSGGATTNVDYGLGRRHALVSAAGQTLTFTFTGTGLDIYWVGGTGTGTFSWAVDGGAATNVNTVLATTTDGNVTPIRGLASGSHTVVVTWVSGLPCYIDGGMVYNGDENAGIRMWDGGHSGATSFYFVDPAKPRWIDNVKTIKPRLVIIGLGTNDPSVGPYTPDQTVANLKTLIANVRAVLPAAGASIVITAAYPRGDASAATWVPYYNAIKAMVESDPTLLLFDAQARFGTAEVNANKWGQMNPDLVHPSDLGHQLYADGLLSVIAPN